MNVYGFVGSDPLGNVDPLGLEVIAGPEAALIHWVSRFNIYSYATEAARREFPRWRDLPLFTSRRTMLMAPMTAFWTSHNARPPQTLRGLDGPVNWGSREHRGYLYFKPKIDCDCGTPSALTSDSWGRHPGWTVLPLGGYDSVSSHPTLVGTLRRTQPKDGCIKFWAEDAARVGWMGQLVNVVFMHDTPPYLYRKIEYTLCCDGTAEIVYSASTFPSHVSYLNGQQVNAYQQTTTTFGDFFFTKGGALAPITRMHTERIIVTK